MQVSIKDKDIRCFLSSGLTHINTLYVMLSPKNQTESKPCAMKLVHLVRAVLIEYPTFEFDEVVYFLEKKYRLSFRVHTGPLKEMMENHVARRNARFADIESNHKLASAVASAEEAMAARKVARDAVEALKKAQTAEERNRRKHQISAEISVATVVAAAKRKEEEAKANAKALEEEAKANAKANAKALAEEAKAKAKANAKALAEEAKAKAKAFAEAVKVPLPTEETALSSRRVTRSATAAAAAASASASASAASSSTTSATSSLADWAAGVQRQATNGVTVKFAQTVVAAAANRS
jgi:hypothetical protein